MSIATESGHYYTKCGIPAYTVPKKDGSGDRNTTIADARKLGLLPSPTTILGVASKPALNRWLQETAITAAMTTPRLPNEALDAFCARVLAEDTRSISDAAKDRGTARHGAIEKALNDQPYDGALKPFVEPVLTEVYKLGQPMFMEKVVVGDGYAGKLDLAVKGGSIITVIDFKSCSKLPKAQYEEHLMQLSSYCYPIRRDNPTYTVESCNIYIDSFNPGAIKVVTNSEKEWVDAYQNGFMPLFKFWQWRNSYQL